MPLAALLIAGTEPAPPLLATPAVEFQLRRARAAGVGHAVVFAERVGIELLASAARLRAEGMSVDVARTVDDAADLIHPDENVLLIASDVIVAPDRLEHLARSKGPCLLCVRDEPGNAHFELIDPSARWTGFGRIDGGLVRRTAAMVGDWDLASTLLRRAVQEGAHRVTLTPDEAVRDIILLDGSVDMQRAGRRLIAMASVKSAGWGTQWLLTPVARLLARAAGEAGIEAKWLTVASLALLTLATGCALAGWVVASLLVLLIGQLLDLAASVGTLAGGGGASWDRFRYPTRIVASAAVALAMGTTLVLRTGQWGCVVLALISIGALWLAAPMERGDRRFAAWRADPAGHAIIGLTGFLLGSPVIALGLAAGHAVLTLGVAVRRVISRLASS